MEEGEPEASSSENSSQEEEEEEEAETKPNNEISEYEQQRLARIRDNKARLQALGLANLASSFLGPPSKRQQSNRANKSKAKKKKKGEEDDDEYRPSDEEDRGQKRVESRSSSGQEEEEQEDVGASSSTRRKGKRKSSSTTVKKKSQRTGNMEQHNDIDEDEALQKAIALSLGGSTEDLAAVSDLASPKSDRNEAGANVRLKREKSNTQETARRRKSNKVTKSRVQLTEDEVVAYFFSFDEAGKGYISLRDLQRIVAANDFSWTDSEVSSMIHSFDSGRAGKLSLEDFRTIVCRCNMLQETGNC